MEEEDERREAAIASRPSLQHNFKPSGGVSQAQVSKFQELHKRRLQIKARPKNKSKEKGVSDKMIRFLGKGLDIKEYTEEMNIKDDSSVFVPEENTMKEKQEIVVGHSGAKRQKLHWGLDTKERWERKANM